MIETLQEIIDRIGPGNALTIASVFIGLAFSYYFSFRNLYRLVYSTGRICRGCRNISDWTKDETEFDTRILFYNNGLKTITKKEIARLEIKSSNKINSIRIIQSDETIKTKINKKRDIVAINVEYLDSSEFFVLEMNHSGKLSVHGRVAETGNLLRTEPRAWLVLNVVFLIFSLGLMIYNLTNLKDKNDLFTSEFITNFLIIVVLFIFMRFVHSRFFIPDSLSSKYLDAKGKFAKEFKNGL
ncbi:MAG: hypothetical protein AB7V25_01175 [Mangrovibacterium sp.]